MPETLIKPVRESRLLLETSPEVEAAGASIGLPLAWLYPIDSSCSCTIERDWNDSGSVKIEESGLIEGRRSSVQYEPGLYLAIPAAGDIPDPETAISPYNWLILKRQTANTYTLVDYRYFGSWKWFLLSDVNADGSLDIVVEWHAADPGGTVEVCTVESTGQLRTQPFHPPHINDELSVPGGVSLRNLDQDPALEMVLCGWYRSFNRGYQFLYVEDFDRRSGKWIDHREGFPEVIGEQVSFYAAYDKACEEILAKRKATGKTIDELLPAGEPLLIWKGKPYDVCLEVSADISEAIAEDHQKVEAQQ